MIIIGIVIINDGWEKHRRVIEAAIADHLNYAQHFIFCALGISTFL